MTYRYKKRDFAAARMEEMALRRRLALGILRIIPAMFSSFRLGNGVNYIVIRLS